MTYTFKDFGGCCSHTFWRVFFSYLFKVAITAERVNSKTTRGCHLSRDCTHLYAMIDKDCGSLEENRVVTWAGGVVVCTVQKKAVFVEAWSVSVALAVQLRGWFAECCGLSLIGRRIGQCQRLNFCEFADFAAGYQRVEALS